MPTPDQLIAHIAERQQGVFTRAQALTCGLSSDQVDRRVASGRWVRIQRGVYRIAGHRMTFEARTIAAVLTIGRGAVAAGPTAGTLWELDGVRSPWIHVLVPHDRRPAARHGVRVRQSRTLLRDDVTTYRAIPITTVPRTLMDLAVDLSEPAFEDAVDSAVRRKRIDPEHFLDVVRDRRRRGVPGLAGLERLLVVRVGIQPSGSSKENRLKRFIDANGLPAPVGQHTISRPDGSFVARVDFAYPDAKVALEFDSYAHHSSRNDWEADLVRQNALVDLGWLPLRITDRQLDTTPEDVLRLIWGRLAAASAVNARQIRHPS